MALVLSRKPGEEIVIGKNIRVAIVGVRDGKTVGVAVSAPKDVRILRGEIEARYGEEGECADTDPLLAPEA